MCIKKNYHAEEQNGSDDADGGNRGHTSEKGFIKQKRIRRIY
jgi:hypothetical protein